MLLLAKVLFGLYAVLEDEPLLDPEYDGSVIAK
jgi:hypothetical protein